MPKNPSFHAFIITALTVIGAVVLLAMGKTVPDQLWAIAGGSFVGGIGAAIPGG